MRAGNREDISRPWTTRGWLWLVSWEVGGGGGTSEDDESCYKCSESHGRCVLMALI